jgi:hypothetical protein
LTVLENEQSAGMEQLQVFGEVGNMIVKNVLCVKDAGIPRSGELVSVKPRGHIGNLVLEGITALGLDAVLSGEGKVDNVIKSNVTEK